MDRGIAVAGNIILDIVKNVDCYPQLGMLANIRSLSPAIGGCGPDDNCDNRFNPPAGRFPAIDEDEPAYRLLCNEYPTAPL